MKIEQLAKRQKRAFREGKTLAAAFRKEALRRLLGAIEEYQPQIEDALMKDLNKPPFESYMTEYGLVADSIKNTLASLDRWTKKRHIAAPLAQFPSDCYTIYEPYGEVLILAPWNYPFLLAMEPLAGAIAAGNCCILKPSEYAPATAKVITEIVEKALPGWLASVVTGGQETAQQLLEIKFDYIFFTGSPAVGKEVLKKAAVHLTPVTLELGGKSPCIVEKSADIRLAAKRIVFGKFLNGGQTCVAPDYVLVQRQVKEELVRWMIHWIRVQFGEKPLERWDYPKIINARHYNRLMGLMEGQAILAGGKSEPFMLRIEPTLLDEPDWESPVMSEEIFGPILPILSFDSIFDVERMLKTKEKPLALYLFTSRKIVEDYILSRCSFGGGCVNDTVIHVAVSRLPFGGVGNSGIGSYHGKRTFETFSHEKGIVKKFALDIPVRYRPYTKGKNRLLHLFL